QIGISFIRRNTAFMEIKRIKFLLLASLLVLNGCGAFRSGETTTSTQQQAPPAPIVVDGVRASYADVVEKTSPAVVRIDAEHKSTQQPQQFPFADNPFFRD